MTIEEDGSDLSDFQPIKRRKSNIKVVESEDEYESSSLSEVSDSGLQEETIVEPEVVVEAPKPKKKKSDEEKEKKPKVGSLYSFNTRRSDFSRRN